MNKKIVFIAPRHAVYDERVVRTVNIAKNFGYCYYMIDKEYYDKIQEKETTIIKNVKRRLGENVKILPLPYWRKLRIINRFSKFLYAYRIAKQVKTINPDIVHVHESGSLGILISYLIKKFNANSKIIFDYHDWIPYEVAKSVKDIEILYNIALPLSLRWNSYLAKSIDIAVCISDGQAKWTKNILGIPKIIVVQNVREPLNIEKYWAKTKTQNRLIFIGNVMKIRRIEFAIDTVANLNKMGLNVCLDICGHIKDRAYADILRSHAKKAEIEDKVIFHGRYRNDQELLKIISRGSVGIVLGYKSLNTNIEKIASANKLFSYLALGVPILIEKGFDNMIEIAGEGKACFSFHSLADCTVKAEKIWNTDNLWERMSKKGLEIAKRMNSTAYFNKISNLYYE